MQNVWKSLKIWQSYREYKGGNFFETQYKYNKYLEPFDTIIV